jgi:hypothetical protein
MAAAGFGPCLSRVKRDRFTGAFGSRSAALPGYKSLHSD